MSFKRIPKAGRRKVARSFAAWGIVLATTPWQERSWVRRSCSHHILRQTRTLRPQTVARVRERGRPGVKGEKDREREEPVVWRGKSSINMALARSDQIWLASLCLPCQFKESLQSSNKQHFSKVLHSKMRVKHKMPPAYVHPKCHTGQGRWDICRHARTRANARSLPLSSTHVTCRPFDNWPALRSVVCKHH